MAELRWGVATHEGQVRSENEDSHYVGPTLFVVADGMGGHQAGEIASQITVERLSAQLTTDSPTLADLVTAIGDVNRDIFDTALHNPEQQGMGTTVTSLAVMDDPDEGEVLVLANVGDSRTYLYRHGRLRQLTIDHSYVQELVAEGHISRDEARYHPRRNIVTRALGVEPSIRVDSWKLPLVREDRYVLCSDGLSDEVTDDELAALLAANDDPQAAADALIDAANASGGRDNITVIVVDVLEGQDPPDPTEEIDVVPAWAADPDDFDRLEHPDPADADTPTAPAGALADAADRLLVDTSEVPVVTAADTAARTSDRDAADTGTADADPTWQVAGPGVTAPDDLDPAPPADPSTAAAAGIPIDGAPPRRRRRLVRFLVTVGVAAVLVVGFTIFAAWARAGYFVAFDDEDDVVIYRGRASSVLWFDATVEASTNLSRDVLDERSVELVEDERRFSTLRSAENFVFGRLTPETTVPETTVPETTLPETTAPETTAATTVPPPDETDNETGDDGGSQTGTTTGD